MKKKSFVFIVSMLLSVSFVLTSCNGASEKPSRTKESDETSISQSETPTPDEEDIDAMIRDKTDQFLSAARDSDFAVLEQLTEGLYTKKDFIQKDWSQSEQLFDLTFGDMEWSITDIVEEDENYLVSVDITYVFPISVAEEVYLDDLKITEVLTPSLLNYVGKMDMDQAASQVMKTCGNNMIDIFDSSPEKMTQENFFRLQYSKKNQNIVVIGLPLPFHFYSDYAYFDVWNILDDSTLTQSIVNTAGVLLEQGEITYEEHYKIMVELVGPQPVIDMSIEEVEALISEKGWFDRETNRFISDYKQDAKEICYVISFSQGVDGLVLYFEFYREGDTEPAGFSSVPTSGLSTVVMIFDDFGGYPSDTYRILVTLADGSVVADESVTLGATGEQKGL